MKPPPENFQSALPEILAGTGCPTHEQTLTELDKRIKETQAEHGRGCWGKVNAVKIKHEKVNGKEVKS